MYGTVLSVLLMGMVPVMEVPGTEAAQHLSVAAPSPIPGDALSRTGFGRSMTASGVVVLDLQSGQELYARNGALRRPMGSLTKLMTALLIVENHRLDEEATVPRGIGSVQGTVANLPPGERFTVGDLLSALLLASANDAAKTLAVFDGGTEAEFVRKMNARADALGLQNTSFANAAGLDAPGQYSTPRDLAWLTLAVLRQPAIRERMGLKETAITSLNGRVIKLSHTHALLHEDPLVIAGKTGTTVAAKQCLLSVVREGDREYVVVLLGSRERYADMRSFLHTLTALFV